MNLPKLMTFHRNREKLYEQDVILNVSIKKTIEPITYENVELYGDPYSVLSDLIKLYKNYGAENIARMELTNYESRYISVNNEDIIEFLIYNIKGTDLSLCSGFMFSVKFKNNKEDCLYDISYVLNRPNNNEFSGMNHIELVSVRDGEVSESYSYVFSCSGLLDISEKLRLWFKTSPSYNTQTISKHKEIITDLEKIIELAEDLNKPEEVIEEAPEFIEIEFSPKDYLIRQQLHHLNDSYEAHGDSTEFAKILESLRYLSESNTSTVIKMDDEIQEEEQLSTLKDVRSSDPKVQAMIDILKALGD